MSIRVYKMNDYEWWASELDKKETNEFYKKELGLTNEDNPLEDIKECNIDKEGMWWETTDEKDLERLGDADEIIGIEKINGMIRKKVRFGDLMRRQEGIFKFISFREAIKICGEYKEPYEIASTEW